MHYINKLQDFVDEFEYLFQEGMAFKSKDIEDIKELQERIAVVLNDKFLNII